MKIGIVSDIHGNIDALDQAIARMGTVDEIWCAGDAFNQYRFSNEVIGRLRELGARYVLGNHEEILLGPHGERARAGERVDRDLLAWCAERPHWIKQSIDGARVLMFHSTPWEPYGEYLYPHHARLAEFAGIEADFVIYGHTHTQMARRVGEVMVINPGSAGLGVDPANGRRLSYAVLDTASGRVDFDDFDDPTLLR
ncbi:MAG: metallophosphoesterase [Gammaproteobacteria bacterium]